jgi:DNA-binding FadR family transcriptional regulator
VRGELRSGATLPPEVQLMEQYGVSRPTLREAFRILETETLITVRRGSRGGAQVMTPELSVAARYVGLMLQMQGTTIDDVYEARMVGEPYCARLLARRRTKQDLTDLRECIEQLRAAADGTAEPGRWTGPERRFHELVLDRSGNRTLAVQGGVLQDIVATHLQLTVAREAGRGDSAGRLQRAIRSYEKLVQLVEDRDAEGAQEHWRRHLEQSAKVVFRHDARSRPVVELFA